MLTSFFGKSKPVNFIIVSIFIITGWFYRFLFDTEGVTTLSFFRINSFLLLIVLFSVFLLNFIIRKNNLTENNTYAILCFSSFTLFFPEIFFRSETILSNVLLLLAFRRIVSLNSGINVEKKILDASIWITIASLLYFWCVLFFIVLFVSVFQLRSKNYKIICIPLVGFLSVTIILTATNIILNNSFFWFLELNTNLSLDFRNYDSLPILIPIIFLLIVYFWTLIQKLINFSEIRLKDKSKSFLLILTLLISAIAIILIPNKNGAEFIYIMAPLAVFATNFIEKSKRFWVKELFLWTLILLPILVIFIGE